MEGADESDDKFDEKVERQFADAAENTRIVFTNVEYLWCLPSSNIGGPRKQHYATRWFPPQWVQQGGEYFFGDDHGIGNTGQWYQQNKYFEIRALLRILQLVTRDSSLDSVSKLKERIAQICYDSIYSGVADSDPFSPIPNKCSAHSVFLHLSAPDTYESISADNHKDRIVGVFGHLLDPGITCREQKLRELRRILYNEYALDADPERKERWFFYMEDIKREWIGARSVRSQKKNSILSEILQEELAGELEGGKEAFSGYRIRRNGKLVQQVKVRDQHTCRACGFHFKNLIVHVHHLDPISERKGESETKQEDLITLCPNCHYLAHYLLRQENNDRYKLLLPLLSSLKKIHAKHHPL